MDYLDFDLRIGVGSGREYPIMVVNAPSGQAHQTMYFPFDELALENRLKDVQIALLRSGRQNRQMPSTEEQAVQDFGRALFEALFTGDVHSSYEASQLAAANQGKGLRLKLRIQPPELAALPWEFLYDKGEREYVCLSSNTPLVRYVEHPRPTQPLTITPPMRILGMTASPHDLFGLDVGREKQRIERALQDLQAQGIVEVTWLEGQTVDDLQQAIWVGPWHVFHFIGHGRFNVSVDEGVIALADENGNADFLRATDLGRLLADHRPLRLVVLNSCEGARGSIRDLFSSTASVLVGRGIPAVLAMQYEITDGAAINLAKTFYRALAKGISIDEAVSEARKTMSIRGGVSVEWGTPVLYMRSPNGILFHVQPETGIPSVKKEQWLDRGDKHFNARHYAEALAAYEHAIRLDPNLAMAYISRYGTLNELKWYKDALAACSQALRPDPNLPIVHVVRGFALSSLNRYEEALTACEQAIRLDSNLAMAYVVKGGALSSLNRREEALTACEQAIRLDPNLAMAYVVKGGALGSFNRYEEALTACEQAIRLDSNLAMAYVVKGGALGSLNRREEALTACEQAIRLDPNLAVAYFVKGGALSSLNRREEALTACEQAIHLDPNLAVAYLNRGMALYYLKRYNEALIACEQGIRLDPNYAVAYYTMGNVLKLLGKRREAERAYAKARQLGYKPSGTWSGILNLFDRLML